MKYLIFIILFLSSCTSKSQYVTMVHDPDTFYTEDRRKIRLADIDAPEVGQLYSIDGTQFLKDLILNKRVKIVRLNYDKYGREICMVYVDGICINQLLVEKGFAWSYKGSKYHSLQEQVRKNKIGLWKYPAIPPFIFRRNKQK